MLIIKEIAFKYVIKCFPGGSNGKESACNVRNSSSIPDWKDALEEGTATPLQYSGLENSKDRGAWWAIVHGIT